MISHIVHLELHKLNAQDAERRAAQVRQGREARTLAHGPRRTSGLIQRARAAFGQIHEQPAADPCPRSTRRLA